MAYSSLTEDSALRPTTLAPVGDFYSDLGYKERPWWRRSIPRRYLVATLAFLGFCNIYAMRVNLGIALVAMNQNTTVKMGDTIVVHPSDFNMDPWSRGVVLSAFFYGYLVTQIPGGWLAPRYGGKRLFGIGVLATAVLTLATPIAAAGSIYLLVAVRVLEGLFEGVTYPSIHTVWSRWAPPLERSRLATLAFSGSYMGTVLAMPLSGVLADRVGWQSVFYVTGSLALVWCVAWWWCVAERPQDDTRISETELHYIRVSIGPPDDDQMNLPIPWKCFMTSAPVWAITVAHFTENWGFYTLLTELPTFVKDSFGYELDKIGYLSALPYLAMTIVVQMGGHLADCLISRSYLTTTQVRKSFNCGAFVAQTAFMLVAAYMTSVGSAIACISLAVGFGGFAWSGFSVNHLDIAPQYASILMGISNTFATIPGIISPTLTGVIVQHQSPTEWKVVFYISAAIYLAGAMFYGLFASGERQKWAGSAMDASMCLDSECDSASEDAPFHARRE